MKKYGIGVCLILLVAACGGTDDSNGVGDSGANDEGAAVDQSSSPDQSSSTDESGSVDSVVSVDDGLVLPDEGSPVDTGPGPGPSDCPLDVFLDVSSAPGAGAGYPAPSLSVSCTDDHIVIETNNIPHYTFIQTTPNALVAAEKTIEIPRNPEWLDEPVDIPFLGLSAVAINGCSIFGPNEGPIPDNFGDPIANDIMDPCLGHTAFEYHYHALKQECLVPSGLVAEPWLNDPVDTSVESPILGYALDGYPIYGSFGRLEEGGAVVKFLSSWERTDATNVGCTATSDCSGADVCALITLNGAEVKACVSMELAWDNNECAQASCDEPAGVYLDKCNGRFGPDGTYRYHATDTFPYVNGCYHGVANTTGGGGQRGGGQNPPDDPNPPGGGPQACTSEADCADACPNAALGCTCHDSPNGQICVPKCTSDSDCPAGGPFTLVCNSNLGICVPSGGPGGM